MLSTDFTISFKNDKWICNQDKFNCKAHTLDEIDKIVLNKFRNEGLKGKINISYHFDFNSFPLWMRQYMPHYFNRNITFII